MDVERRHNLCMDIVHDMIDEDLINLNQSDRPVELALRCAAIIELNLSSYILVDGNTF